MKTIATTSSVNQSTLNPKQPQQRQTAKEIIAANVAFVEMLGYGDETEIKGIIVSTLNCPSTPEF